MNIDKKNLLVVGGGAAGFFAAIRAAEKNPQHCIYLIEASHDPLRKVRISGGGRCNVTHHCFDPTQLSKNYPRGSRELLSLFARFQPKDTVVWFESRGVKLKVESDGRMFPITDSSQTIIDCLITSAENAKVNIHLQTRVKKIIALNPHAGEQKKFHVEFAAQNLSQNSNQNSNPLPNEFDAILLATGSTTSAYTIPQNLGHTITPLAPSLFTFKIQDPRIENLAGISFPHTSLTLHIDKKKFHQSGPLLITHWGLSGPAVLKLSAFAARELQEHKYQAQLSIQFSPNHKNPETALQQILEQKEKSAKKKILHANPFHLPERYWEKILKYTNTDTNKNWADLSKKSALAIAHEITQAAYQINGKGEFKEEFVTCGGVDLKEIHFPSMESKIIPGLFFAGEILDIDGITGGFNFQNAWSTAFLAAEHMLTTFKIQNS